jgi:hypothetical protein
MAVISCTGEPGHEIQPDPPARLRIMSAMALPNGIPSLATEEGQRWFEPYLDMSQVFIFDHLSALFRGAGEENDASSWDSTQEWLLRLRAMGKTLCFAHHDNKSREQRGTSKREDVLSVSIHLKELEDDEADGTHFKVKFDKSRSVSGDPIAPFEARLVPQDGTGFRRHWVISSADDEVDLEIEEMLKLGRSVRQIAIKLKISHGSAQRKVTRIRNKMMNVGSEVGGEK